MCLALDLTQERIVLVLAAVLTATLDGALSPVFAAEHSILPPGSPNAGQ